MPIKCKKFQSGSIDTDNQKSGGRKPSSLDRCANTRPYCTGVCVWVHIQLFAWIGVQMHTHLVIGVCLISYLRLLSQLVAVLQELTDH